MIYGSDMSRIDPSPSVSVAKEGGDSRQAAGRKESLFLSSRDQNVHKWVTQTRGVVTARLSLLIYRIDPLPQRQEIEKEWGKRSNKSRGRQNEIKVAFATCTSETEPTDATSGSRPGTQALRVAPRPVAE